MKLYIEPKTPHEKPTEKKKKKKERCKHVGNSKTKLALEYLT